MCVGEYECVCLCVSVCVSMKRVVSVCDVRGFLFCINLCVCCEL